MQKSLPLHVSRISYNIVIQITKKQDVTEKNDIVFEICGPKLAKNSLKTVRSMKKIFLLQSVIQYHH